MNMKTTAVAILSAALLAGCASQYDYMDNWLIREDPVRQFAVGADVIYLQDALYTNVHTIAAMLSYARDEVGRGRFENAARVFAPLVSDADDLGQAIKWYLKHSHAGKRPFFFIGEGVGGELLKAYEEENLDDLLDEGFVAGYYSAKTHNGFVTDALVRTIQTGVIRVRYREQWGREMSDDMLKQSDKQENGSN